MESGVCVPRYHRPQGATCSRNVVLTAIIASLVSVGSSGGCSENPPSRVREDWEKAGRPLPDGWEVTGACPFIDDIISHKGKHSLKLSVTGPDGKPKVLMPEIAVKPGDIVEISLHVKGDPVQGPGQKSGIVLQLQWQKPNEAVRMQTLAVRTRSSNADWTQVTGRAEVPQGVGEVRILAGFPIGTDGVLWLDDVDVGAVSELPSLLGLWRDRQPIWAGVVVGFLWGFLLVRVFRDRDLRQGSGRYVCDGGAFASTAFGVLLWGWGFLLGLFSFFLLSSWVERVKRVV
jgi:hypothetical protein